MKDRDATQLFNEGEVLYRVGRYGIDEVTIISVEHYPHCVYRDDHGHSYFNHSISKSCFRTREEAENEQLRREKINRKRRLLKDYESQLNYELGIENHFIIK